MLKPDADSLWRPNRDKRQVNNGLGLHQVNKFAAQNGRQCSSVFWFCKLACACKHNCPVSILCLRVVVLRPRGPQKNQ